MLIKACLKCEFHEIKQEKEAQLSYCRKEGCWSQFSKCLSLKAIDRFLDEEYVSSRSPFQPGHEEPHIT